MTHWQVAGATQASCHSPPPCLHPSGSSNSWAGRQTSRQQLPAAPPSCAVFQNRPAAPARLPLLPRGPKRCERAAPPSACSAGRSHSSTLFPECVSEEIRNQTEVKLVLLQNVHLQHSFFPLTSLFPLTLLSACHANCCVFQFFGLFQATSSAFYLTLTVHIFSRFSVFIFVLIPFLMFNVKYLFVFMLSVLYFSYVLFICANVT